MIKMWAITGGLAVLGGLIGYSGVLCPDGSCAITGSWYGGATMGGLLGYGVFAGFMGGHKHAAPGPEAQQQADPDDLSPADAARPADRS